MTKKTRKAGDAATLVAQRFTVFKMFERVGKGRSRAGDSRVFTQRKSTRGVIAFGLSSLVVLGCSSKSAHPPSMDGERVLTLHFGTREAQPYLLSGWAKGEGSPGATFQWSDDASSRLELYLEHAPEKGMWLAASVGKPSEIPNQAISTIVNDHATDSVSLTAPDQWFRAIIPADALHAGANEIEFRYAGTARPSHYHVGSNDIRRLGVLWRTIDFGFLSAGQVVGIGGGKEGVALGDGWAWPEPWSSGKAVWGTGASSSFDFCLAPTGGDYALVLNVKTETETGPVPVPFFMGDQRLGLMLLDTEMSPRVLKVPANKMQWGHNRIEARYPRPFQPAAINVGSGDRRLLGMLLTSAALVPAPSVATAEPADPVDHGTFVAGWGSLERSANESALQTSGVKATLQLAFAPLASSYRVVIEGQSIGLQQEDVRVRVNGNDAGNMRFDANTWHAASLRVSPHVLVAGKNTVELSYGGQVLDNSKGSPPLTVRVRRVRLVPDAATW